MNRVATGLAVIVLVLACASPVRQTSARCDIASHLLVPDGIVGLTACAPEASVSRADRRIFVALVNRSQVPVIVRARLDIEDGLEVSLSNDSDGWERLPVTGYLWEQSDIPSLENVLLPPGGVLGRAIDLACPVPDHGDLDWVNRCVPLADFSSAGTYRIRVRYDGWICAESPCSRPQSMVGYEDEVDFELVVRPE